MTGVRDALKPEQRGHLAKAFGKAMIECLLEAEELIPYVIVAAMLGFVAYLVAGMVYHLMFDPNAVDVASRLDLLSIDPEKWFPRS